VSEILDVFRQDQPGAGADQRLKAQSRALATKLFGFPNWADQDRFRLIQTPINAAGTGTYTLSGIEFLDLISVSATVDTTAAGAPTVVRMRLLDPSGAPMITNQSGSTLDPGITGEITFASYLPDSSTFPAPISGSFIQTGSPLVAMSPGTSIEIEALDPGAVVTQARIWAWDMAHDLKWPGAVPAYRLVRV